MREVRKNNKKDENSINISKKYINKISSNYDNIEELFNDFNQRKAKIMLQNEEMLKKSEELENSISRYQNLYEFAPAGHFTLNDNGLIIEVNFALAKLLGEKKIDLLGKKFSKFIDPIFVEKFHNHLKDVLKNRIPQISELELTRKDGKKLTVQLKTISFFNSDGKLEFRNAVLDLSKLKEAEEKIRLSTNYNRCLIETSLDPLITIATDGTITDTNQAAEKIIGYSRNELKGTKYSKYVTEPEKAEDGFRQVLKKGKLKNYPLELIHRDGHLTPVLCNSSTFKDKFGKIVGVFVAARDISEQIRANEKIKQLANIVEYSDDAIIGKSIDGTIISWNKGAENIFGYSASEIVGKHVEILKYPEIKGRAEKIIQMLKKGKRLTNFETVRFRKDGTKIDVSISCSPVFNSSGELIGTSTIARDISKRKKAERKLKEYQKNLEKIVKERTKELDFQAQILKQVRDAIIVTNAKKRIKYWNKGAEELYGIKSEYAVNRFLNDILKTKWLSVDDEKAFIIHMKKRVTGRARTFI
ncbi:MAG: PAS domain S-box protein [Methanobacteriaceae archaeon]|nr:PAS domain S-box protein [Methanobacteriaceae archaeon]